ncbi:unnamed protein product [Rotaria socialis]|uniref:Uncharacterized protein n=1 Tax=Rotaria socialis TaxID=392032 RepID=A0A820Y5T2_9BILA|nr:unnamed protein product [Rotaria socialis]CAF3505566.1 unnamed protein product [Rotaria socialis]CAF3510357.1 unnamed protein product [Rotaria socialis]CAF3541319.1 unnamed protein product [Rotaria socialis]CAF4372878.1 unnamed protein product [Rotaria socialis]
MNIEDENRLKLIEKVFTRFLIQTQSDSPQLSRDYFERFTQLLNQTFQKYSQLKSSIETIISSIIYPYHLSNIVTFEYQLRLIRFSLRQHLQILELNKNDYLHELFHHKLLLSSSIVRHLSLQIALLIYEHDFYQSFDDIFFSHIIKLFSSDPNLYVRNILAQFLALYISKHDQYQLLNQIQQQSQNADLIYDILILFDEDKQKLLINEMNIYENLLDSTATRAFVLKTARYKTDEDQIVFYLNRVLEKSLSDYVHMLLTIISSRYEYHRSINKLSACLKGLFLYIKEVDIEEIDEHEQNILVNDKDEFNELIESICCLLYERNIQSVDLASIVLDSIQTFIVNSNSFIYKLDFYSSTILMMLTAEHDHDKNFAQLINCYEKLEEFNLLINTNNNLYEIIISQVKNKKRTTLVYQSLFNLILHTTNKKAHFESIHSIVETLLFQDTDPLLQWDNQDCVLHFLIQFIKQNEYPSWFTNEFLRRIIEKFVHNTNEYVQGSLIDFLATLIAYDFISPLDNYLTTNFIQLTQYSLGDVVRCSLAHAWYIILTKATENNLNEKKENDYQFSFGINTNFDSLLTVVMTQVPVLIGDGGHETEIQCLRLIEFIGKKDKGLDNILEFLMNDGCSNEIKEKASQLLSISNDKTTEKKNDEILDDELTSILHWLEHPDEHMVLDCD